MNLDQHDSTSPDLFETDDARDNFKQAYVSACRAGSKLMAFMNALGNAEGDPSAALAAIREVVIEAEKTEAAFSLFARLSAPGQDEKTTLN